MAKELLEIQPWVLKITFEVKKQSSGLIQQGNRFDQYVAFKFTKDSGKYIEEKKLKLVLVNPPHSPVLLPNDGELKKGSCFDLILLRDIAQKGVKNIPPPHGLAEDVPVFETAKDPDDLRVAKDFVELIPDDMGHSKSANDATELKLVKDFQELQSRLCNGFKHKRDGH